MTSAVVMDSSSRVTGLHIFKSEHGGRVKDILKVLHLLLSHIFKMGQ